MKILGFQKQSLIEYPGKISAAVFLGGCNLLCPFCHVSHLVLPEEIEKQKEISQREIFPFLKERRNFLEAVAITGGEPTINKDLLDFIKKIKELGYLVELETNGTNPEMLKYLIDEKLVDYGAIDIKHRLDDFKKYKEITRGILTNEMFKNIKKSVRILISGKVDYELRTTIMKEFHKKKTFWKFAKKFKEQGFIIFKIIKKIIQFQENLHPIR
jgi:pyruvate formate lyase activating enzyme